PASSTPLSSIELAKIIAKTNLPAGAFSVLPMDRKNGNKMVTDERFSVLSFTGSAEVGWEMKKNAGKKKVLLELGGNAAVIISDDADIDEVCKKSVVAGFSYSGQICIHAQRFYIHEKVMDKFTSAFVKAVKELKSGDPKDAETDVSVMIDQANADRVEVWVNEAVDKGAKVLCGGKKDGSFYEPTIITNASGDMKVYSEEVFGPVVTIDTFSTMEEAVAKVNDSKFGLQAGVFTNSQKDLDYAFNNLQVGGVILNDMPTFRADHMPYGGVKDSGFGREGVRYAMLEMMEPRILVK
ncbi:MAG TPA: aldehyde dehydrogenase family protein, partial [Bacteroidia bacterium]|nr:aldehyde dehydrogenase family protein [Bacteroidia bacterium]